MQQKCKALLVLFVILLLALPSAATVPGNRDRGLQVMTRNMDGGSDFAYVLQAVLGGASDTQLLIAITQTFAEMHGSQIAARADLVAAEIQSAQPDLVGLQELTTLKAGPAGGPLATVDDSLEALMAALEERGLHYKILQLQTNASLTLPALGSSYNLITVGLTDADAVLARSDLPVDQFKVENISFDHFSDAVTLKFEVAGQSIPFTRGWIAVDAKLRGKTYRFVTTHLETFSPDYQAAQTNELIDGPLQTSLPVILAGDLNSDAANPSWVNGPAYGMLISAGFDDVWLDLKPTDPGLTWPLFGEDPPIGPTSLFQRIDLVLTKGDRWRAENIVRTGTSKVDDLWASDHAGVVASFTLLP